MVHCVVVGGGLVGSALAAAVARRTTAIVVLVDPLPRIKFSETRVPQLRVSAISPSSKQLLESIGAWQKLDINRVQQYADMKVWDWFSNGKVAFSAKDMQAYKLDTGGRILEQQYEPLGYIVENEHLQYALQETALESGVQWVNAKVSGIDLTGTNEGNCAKITIERVDDGKVEDIEADLVVGSDGARSIVKKLSNISSYGIKYLQEGVVASVELQSSDMEPTAWQRFLPLGPLAVLPSFGPYASIVWSTSPSHAKELVNMSAEEFVREINWAYSASPDEFGKSRWFTSLLPKQFEELLPMLLTEKFTPPRIKKLVSKRASFPLQIQHSSCYIKPRLALIGDAAHVVHPLAGQGVNLGFDDVENLSNCISEALDVGSDIGSLLTLESFDGTQRRRNAAKMAGIHALQRIFSVPNGPIAQLRGVGLDIVDSVPFLKEKFAQIAAGKI